METPLLHCVLGSGAWPFARLTRDYARLHPAETEGADAGAAAQATGTAAAAAAAGARSDESRKCGEIGSRAGEQVK